MFCFTIYMTNTESLTFEQAAALTRLSHASNDLRSALKGLQNRTSELIEAAEKGHHLSGFDSDVLGQDARKVQHLASRRSALIECCLNCPPDALTAAVTERGTFGGRIFREGEEFAATDAD